MRFPLDEEERALLSKGQTDAVLRHYRVRVNCSLQEARLAVELHRLGAVMEDLTPLGALRLIKDLQRRVEQLEKKR